MGKNTFVPKPHKHRYAYKTKDHSDLLPREIAEMARDNAMRCRMIDKETEDAQCMRDFLALSPMVRDEAIPHDEL